MSSIVSLYSLKEMFPFTQFPQQKATSALHFYLVHDQFKENQQQWVSQIPLKTLQYQATPFKLSPLHIAVIKGNELATLLLLQRGKKLGGLDLSPLDSRGWTPLHHALVGGNKIIKELLLKADKEHVLLTIRNHQGLTPLDFEKFLHPTLDRVITFNYFNNQTQQIEQKTHEFFLELTGANLTDRMIINPEELVKNWVTFPTDSVINRVTAYFKDKYKQEFKQHPPLLYVREAPQRGLIICAQEKIERYQLIVPYLGQALSSQASLLNTCQRHQVDDSTYRNLGPMIKDGFPNVGVLSIPPMEDLPQVVIHYALQPIEPGEELLINYGGAHFVKQSHHTEAHLEQLIEIFKSISLSKFYQTLVKRLRLKEEMEIEKQLEFEALRSQLAYLFQTPPTLLKLISKNSVTYEEIYKLYFGDSFFKLTGLDECESAKKTFLDILTTLERYEKWLGKEEFNQFLFSLLEKRQFAASFLTLNWLSFCDLEVDQLDNPSIQEKWLSIADQLNEVFDLVDREKKGLTTYELKAIEQILVTLSPPYRTECLDHLIARIQPNYPKRATRLQKLKLELSTHRSPS